MTESPDLSHLQRAVQKLGLEDVIPNFSQASDAELQAPFAKYLSYGECHEELGIGEDFNPTKLPLVPFAKVKNATDYTRRPHEKDCRSPLMIPYFCTIGWEDSDLLISSDLREAPLPKGLLDSDVFLRCRMFFRSVVQAVEQGYYIVILKNEVQQGTQKNLYLHIKALRMLKALPHTVQREWKETVLLQVEYYSMSEEEYERSEEDYDIILSAAASKSKTRIHFGTENQIQFTLQVLQAHERLLEKTFISEHNKEWSPSQKYIRPSFIVPLTPLTLRSSNDREIILQEIKGTFMAACNRRSGSNVVESDIIKDACAGCGKTNVKLNRCSACKTTKYCTRECQVSDWKCHKQTCRATTSDLK